MIIHQAPSRYNARFWLPCCDVEVGHAEPGIVTSDPSLVTCPGPEPFVEYFTTGSFIRIDSGTFDVGLVRDLALFYGERWRPWKRHLHHRWIPVPQRVRRWFGWRPSVNHFESFVEEWERPLHVQMVSPPPWSELTRRVDDG